MAIGPEEEGAFDSKESARVYLSFIMQEPVSAPGQFGEPGGGRDEAPLF